MNYTIFGESHGPAIGVTLTGVPAGLVLDPDAMNFELARRATGKNALSTARKEADAVEILSGVFEGKTTGTPLTLMIRNTDQHSKDYAATKDLARPGHADYTGHLRYAGCNDYRGGGHFSGRLTAPLVAAGAIAKQALAQRGVFVGAHIASVAGIRDEKFPLEPTKDLFASVAAKPFPTLNDAQGAAMQDAILAARQDLDSVGGEIECAMVGLPAGVGAPDYGCNVEGILSCHLFAVPAVKGIAFGDGFGLTGLRGSEANDPFYMDGDTVKTRTNRNGGVNGGITNGMPVVFTVAMKPTPSIARKQQTVDFVRKQDADLEIVGRHDPCIVHRAVPVIEAAAALAACQLLGI
jgi:chorismate synthase